MHKLVQKLRKSEGFTLLELLVVVAIIAILATLILANLNRARRQAQDAKVQSEVKAISDAIQLYQTDPSADVSVLLSGGTTLSGTRIPPLTVLTTGTDPLLRTVPTHPNTSKSYLYKATNTSGIFSYTVAGDLVTKDSCFRIKDGVASTTTGACPSAPGL